MCCCHSSKNYGKVLCCIPLAPFVLVVSVLLLIWSAIEIWMTVSTVLTTDQNWNFSNGLGLGLACFRALAALFGIFAVICKKACGIAILRMGFKMVLAISIVSFVAQWIVWILWFCGVNWGNAEEIDGKWKPNNEEIAYIVVFTVLNIVFFGLAYWILSAMKSLQFVLGVGGTGWEGLNYEEVKESQKQKQLDEAA